MSTDASYKQKNYCTGPLGFPMLEETARALDDILEKHSSESTLSYKHSVKGDAFEHFIEKERADVSVITDSSVDKTNEVVDAKGVKFDLFNKSPVVTLGHNYKIPPVGKSLWQKQVQNSWKAKTAYASRPDSHPKEAEWIPDTIFHLVKEGMMPGKSIGFLPLKGHVPSTQEINEVHKGNRVDFVFDEVQVFEYAVCTVQCNNNALVEAVGKGQAEVLKLFLPEDERKKLEEAEQKLLEAQTKSLVVKGRTLEEYKETITKAVDLLLEQKLAEVPTLIDDAFAKLMGKV